MINPESAGAAFVSVPTRRETALKLLVLLLSVLLTLAACSQPRPVPRDARTATPAAPDHAGDRKSTPLPPAEPPREAPARKPLPSPPAPPPPVMELSRSTVAGYYRPVPWSPAVNRENYAHYQSNPVRLVTEHPVSTFGIDVDTGSYTNVRRMLNAGHLPPADAVRAEEFINYFDYGYKAPADRSRPFSVTTELAPAPWNRQRELLLIGIQGYHVPKADIPAANLVFLVDTSGSMRSRDKLPLLKASLKLLVRQLRPGDRVAIVTYAGSAGVALPSTPGDRHATIDTAIDQLRAGGSTNGGAGLRLAYQQARQGFIEDGVNRVILATDGDFNVGTVDREALETMVEDKRRSGIALSTLGFGRGNYNDVMAMTLADAGNGSYHYIDNLQEGRRVLVGEMSQTLLTIAKDVKIQVEFNPAQVREYRLIGYVKRKLRRADFNNDRVDAGDIGAGANVTALYEITRTGSPAARIDPSRYTEPATTGRHGDELAYLRLRYKLPGEARSRLVEQPIDATAEAHAGPRLRFAAAVAAFAGALRGGKYLDGYDYADIAGLAAGARGTDPEGTRAGFVQLVKLAGSLATPAPAPADAAAPQ